MLVAVKSRREVQLADRPRTHRVGQTPQNFEQNSPHNCLALRDLLEGPSAR